MANNISCITGLQRSIQEQYGHANVYGRGITISATKGQPLSALGIADGEYHGAVGKERGEPPGDSTAALKKLSGKL